MTEILRPIILKHGFLPVRRQASEQAFQFSGLHGDNVPNLQVNKITTTIKIYSHAISILTTFPISSANPHALQVSHGCSHSFHPVTVPTTALPMKKKKAR